MRSGGIESMICGLANEMAKTEDVSVCSIFKPQDKDVFWSKLSPAVHKVTLGKEKPGFSVKEIFRIYKLIKLGRFDVVNMHGMFYYYAFSVLMLHHKTAFFYTVHSDAVMENASWDAKFLPLKKYCFRKGYVRPVTISNASQASFQKLYHCQSTLIYNGVPKPELSDKDLVLPYKITPNTKVFIHAGRIDTPKNQIVLCKVFRRLIDEKHDIVLLIAGPRQREDIYRSIEPFFCKRIQYIGERDDIPLLMAHSVGMCLPSIWEGLPVVLLEALSVGCIPICSPVGGIVDVVKDGYNGFLSKSSSEADYYKAMKSFLSIADSSISQIKNNCKDSFSKYNIVNTAASYLKAYQNVKR